MRNSIGNLYFKTAIVLLLTGMAAGIAMAASGNHSIYSAHAHLNLLGFVVTSIYGGYFTMFPAKAAGPLPKAVLGLHAAGTVAMFPSLSLVLLGHEAMEPVVAVASIIVFLGAVTFAVAVFREPKGSEGINERSKQAKPETSWWPDKSHEAAMIFGFAHYQN
ncbi:hypothetical protein HDIA_4096 [Hartmannibacter diazotrophicus]|uniref:Uncharacterized protein n=2 Tax=Hartmannibacter diazotrophicus TaxID=1482074 RepID=A0A2C9DBG4_9HYPH|nr:hypothetical protein HDIA_4096 [Hartmannibacter diazotrophicus]